MKKILVPFIIVFCCFNVVQASELDFWITDVNANNGHVTYTFNIYLPSKNGTMHIRNRRDYICSQQKEAILWGEAEDTTTGEFIDYSFMIDKTKLRTYAPVDRYDYAIIQQILPYCD